MSNRKEKLSEGTSDFLKKLHTAVSTGDPNKGLDAIKKINEIHKLADSMSGEVASAKFEKRFEESGVKKELTLEERKEVTLKSEREKIKREIEDERLKMVAEIQNAEYEIKAVEKEWEEVQVQYDKVIKLQKDELEILNIKYEAKFGKENE